MKLLAHREDIRELAGKLLRSPRMMKLLPDLKTPEERLAWIMGVVDVINSGRDQIRRHKAAGRQRHGDDQ